MATSFPPIWRCFSPAGSSGLREVFYFGNVEDGEVMQARVARVDDDTRTVLEDRDGRRLFLSRAVTPLVEIAER